MNGAAADGEWCDYSTVTWAFQTQIDPRAITAAFPDASGLFSSSRTTLITSQRETRWHGIRNRTSRGKREYINFPREMSFERLAVSGYQFCPVYTTGWSSWQDRALQKIYLCCLHFFHWESSFSFPFPTLMCIYFVLSERIFGNFKCKSTYMFNNV